jgi:hypothetical protein
MLENTSVEQNTIEVKTPSPWRYLLWVFYFVTGAISFWFGLSISGAFLGVNQ